MYFPLIGGPATEGDLVTAQPFKATGTTVLAGGGVAFAAVITAIVNAVADLNLPPYGIAAVIAAGLLAAAIAGAGDVFARAYVQAHVPPVQAEPPEQHAQLGEFDVAVANGNLVVHALAHGDGVVERA